MFALSLCLGLQPIKVVTAVVSLKAMPGVVAENQDMETLSEPQPALDLESDKVF